ncbi:MAG TPA: beta-propeller fold lactonase family protein [Sulfuricaulis sp.]|nr:beta-propeller fold lactonase family protein [Sulfuricaulis sp.]
MVPANLTSRLFTFIILFVLSTSLLADSTVELRHVGTFDNDFAITVLAWHPDGRHLAVGQVLNKRIAIWDTQSGKLVRTLEKEAGGVRALAYSPDGKYMAVGREFSQLTKGRAHVHLYDAMSGNLLQGFPPLPSASNKTSDAEALAFSPDSRYLAASGHGSSDAVVLYDITTKRVFAYSPDVPKGEGTVEALAFSPDGRFFAIGRNIGKLEVWSTKPWKLHENLDGQNAGVHALAFSPDGNYLASGTNVGERWDRTVKPPRQMFGNFPDDIVLWSVPAFEKAHEFPSRHFKQTPNSSIIERLQFSPDGKLLLVSARAGSLEIINVTTGQAALFKDGFGAVVHAALSPDGKHLALGLGKKIEIHELNVR